MTTITLKDSAGATQTVAKVVATHDGTAVSTAALPVALAMDDAVIGAASSAAAASDTAAANINSLLKRIAQNLTTVNNSLSGTNAQLPATPSGVALASITRPANVTAYSVGDSVGGVIALPTGLTSGQRGMVASVDLMPQVAALPTGMAAFMLYLYSTTPPSAIVDNGPWTFPAGDRSIFLGAISIPAVAAFNGTLYAQFDGVNRPFQLSGSANMYAYLVTSAGYTPAANSEVYQLRLHLLGL